MNPTEPWQLLLLAFLWCLFFLLHSLLATIRMKSWVAGRLPWLMPAYRLLYNGVALAALWPLIILMRRWGGEVLWRWEGGAALISNGVALLAAAGFLWSLRGYDMGEFMGLRQLRLGIRTVKDQESFKLTPLHRIVRHPWYFLLLAYLWTREMDQAFLTSAVCWSLYLVVGSRLEEGRLIALHGEVYRRYRKLVPGLAPLPWRFLRAGQLRELEALYSGQGQDDSSRGGLGQ